MYNRLFMLIQPQILIVDEPTSYLDHDTLGAFEWVIDNFDDGIMRIGNNNEFCYQLYSETWLTDADHS